MIILPKRFVSVVPEFANLHVKNAHHIFKISMSWHNGVRNHSTHTNVHHTIDHDVVRIDYTAHEKMIIHRKRPDFDTAVNSIGQSVDRILSTHQPFFDDKTLNFAMEFAFDRGQQCLVVLDLGSLVTQTNFVFDLRLFDLHFPEKWEHKAEKALDTVKKQHKAFVKAVEKM